MPDEARTLARAVMGRVPEATCRAALQAIAGRIAGSDFVCLPNAGHIAHVEAPAAFNAAVLAFMQRHFAVA